MLNGGLVLGAMSGFLFSGEFRLTFPRFKRQYLQVLTGGVLMGYSAALASGCAVGAFFSAVPSLGFNGLVFGLALAAGAFAGVKIVNRIG
ncbi:MAG: YeeE/YedE family protein [Dehalococcoidaceae bacterium]|nr:YeeE/YedE family protein [Dehalococcoidaceae bacterium]